MDSSLLPNRSAFTRQQGSRVYGYGPDSVSIRLTGPKREKSSVSRLSLLLFYWSGIELTSESIYSRSKEKK